MPIYVRRYFGRAAIRNSDQRLVPAIIACNFSVCFLLFGVFLTISGVIFRSIASSSEKEFSSSPSRTAMTVGTVILSIGSILAGIGLALLIFAWISFKRYETIRRNELQNNSAGLSNVNFETSFSNVGQTVHYPPPQPNLYQHQTNGYQPQQLYTISDDLEPPPSYSTEPQRHSSNPPKY